MSSTLQRLVGRATGHASTSLRPRRPARFETGLGSGLQEVHVEHVSPASRRDRALREPSIDRPLSAERGDVTALPTDEPPRLLAEQPGVVREAAAAPRHAVDPAPPLAPVSGAPLPAPLVPSPPARTPGEMHVAGPAARGTAADRSGSPTLDAPERDALGRDDDRRATSSRRDSEARRAPEPLLPPDRSASLGETLAAALTQPGAAPASAAPADADEAGPPEITIHIGRLDIRTDAPRPAPTRTRAAPARSLPSLSDYLRGRRS